MTREQEGRLIERIATILHHDKETEGFTELCDSLDLPYADAEKFFERERDRLLRRAALRLGGEAQTDRGLDATLHWTRR
jgi:hypothetical protein